MKIRYIALQFLTFAWYSHATADWVSRLDDDGNQYSERIVKIMSISSIDPDELDYDKDDELFPSRYHVELSVSTDGAGDDSVSCPDSRFVYIGDEAARPRRGKHPTLDERFIARSAERDAMFTLATIAVMHNLEVRVAIIARGNMENSVLEDFPSEKRGSSGHRNLCRLIGIQVLRSDDEDEAPPPDPG